MENKNKNEEKYIKIKLFIRENTQNRTHCQSSSFMFEHTRQIKIKQYLNFVT